MATKDHNEMDYPQKNLEALDWIQLRHDMDKIEPIETFLGKMKRKFSDNPLVPIGSLATVAALVMGIWSFRTGNRQMSQYMMRSRVAAQGLTVAAVVAGVFMGFSKS